MQKQQLPALRRTEKGDAESRIETMKRAGIVMADSPAGLVEPVFKAIG